VTDVGPDVEHVGVPGEGPPLIFAVSSLTVR
jgi:hypothetical protein